MKTINFEERIQKMNNDMKEKMDILERRYEDMDSIMYQEELKEDNGLSKDKNRIIEAKEEIDDARRDFQRSVEKRIGKRKAEEIRKKAHSYEL